MSERIDRRIGNNSLIAAVVLLFSGIAGIALWFFLKAPAPAPPIQPPAAAEIVRSEEPLSVPVYMARNGILSAEQKAVKRQPDAQSQAREILNAVLDGAREISAAPLKDVNVRSFFLDAEGTGYVDLNPTTENGIRASAEEELLALYAIVNTLTQSIEEIRRVRFLVDGREAQTLAGHIDVAKPFVRRTDLIKQ
jgi:hypothetical protein